MLIIVGLGLAFNSIWSQAGVLGTNSNFGSAALLDATNQQRASDHESSLNLNQQLAAAAQAKADDMAARDYWAHIAPDGKTPWTLITGAGYHYQQAGENLAYGFADAGDTVAGWMNSPTHRANMLNGSYQDVGFGVAQSPNYQGHGPATIVVAEYGQPAETAAVPVGSGVAGAPDPTTELSARPVSRIQVLTGGQAAWTTAALSALAGAAIAVFIVRHGLRFRKLILQGEHFIASRPLLDIGLVFVGTLAVIFVQASGSIH